MVVVGVRAHSLGSLHLPCTPPLYGRAPPLERPCPQQVHKIESRLPGQHIGELGLGLGPRGFECRRAVTQEPRATQSAALPQLRSPLAGAARPSQHRRLAHRLKGLEEAISTCRSTWPITKFVRARCSLLSKLAEQQHAISVASMKSPPGLTYLLTRRSRRTSPRILEALSFWPLRFRLLVEHETRLRRALCFYSPKEIYYKNAPEMHASPHKTETRPLLSQA